jgi:hypothetical protein
MRKLRLTLLFNRFFIFKLSLRLKHLLISSNGFYEFHSINILTENHPFAVPDPAPESPYGQRCSAYFSHTKNVSLKKRALKNLLSTEVIHS